MESARTFKRRAAEVRKEHFLKASRSSAENRKENFPTTSRCNVERSVEHNKFFSRMDLSPFRNINVTTNNTTDCNENNQSNSNAGFPLNMSLN